MTIFQLSIGQSAENQLQNYSLLLTPFQVTFSLLNPLINRFSFDKAI